jgi:hypothetical protein
MRLQLGRGTFEGKQIFSDRQSRKMWTAHMSFVVGKEAEKHMPSRHFNGYGLGWGINDYLGRRVISHGGGYDGMFSHQALIPEENLGVIILTNSMTGISNALTQRVIDAYLGAPERDWSAENLKREQEGREHWKAARLSDDSSRVMNTKPSFPLEAYCGTFGGPLYGDAEVKLENGKLVVQFLPNPELLGDLTHWHFDTFAIQWRKRFPWFGGGKIQFIMNASGKVSEMKIDVPNQDFWFTELEFKKK